MKRDDDLSIPKAWLGWAMFLIVVYFIWQGWPSAADHARWQAEVNQIAAQAAIDHPAP